MGDSLVGLGKPLGGSIAVGVLPEDAEVAFAIRLEGDPLTIGRPDGIAIRCRSRKGQTARGSRAGQLVNPNARFLAVVDLIRDSFAVPGHARKAEYSRWNLQWLDFTFTIN